MLKDFTKLETFLSVVKEKSFSKASKKLGISQPAVTQQIKLLEEYIEDNIVDRKKNGISLTKTGEELYKIAIRLEKAVNNSEKDITKLIDKDIAFIIGASFMIGNYILPNFFNKLQEEINHEITLKVDVSSSITEDLLDKKIDFAILEERMHHDDIIFKEWMEDELFLVSKSPLPKVIKAEDLCNFRWICRGKNSHTRKIAQEAFDIVGVDCKSFHMKSTVTSSTAIKQMILKTEIGKVPTVSIISKNVIKDELEDGTLHCASIKGHKLSRTLYIAYLKDRKSDMLVDSTIAFLMKKKVI